MNERLIKKLRKILSLALLKLVTVVILCSAGLSALAQSQVEKDIYDAPERTGVVTIDGVDWYVVKKRAIGSELFAMLVSTGSLMTNKQFNNNNNNYEGSLLQSEITTFYTNANWPDIKRMAVVPTWINKGTSQAPGPAASDTSLVYSPITMASTQSPLKDILFVPGFQEVFLWNNNNGSLLLALPLTNYTANWWLRTFFNNNNMYWVNTAGGTISDGSGNTTLSYSSRADFVGGIWVKYSPNVLIYDGNGYDSGTVPTGGTYAIGASVPVADPGDMSNTGYTFAGWSYSPSATASTAEFPYVDGVLTTNSLIITGSTTLYAVWEPIPPGFYINDIYYTEANETVYCTNSFEFRAFPDILTDVTWDFNGTPIDENPTNIFTRSGLADGQYTVIMTAYGETYTAYFYIGERSAIWMPQFNPGADKQNWRNPANWMPNLIPSACVNIYIPGDCNDYPVLQESDANVCKDIYFMQGGEIGFPNFLGYNKAHVHLNFDLKDGIVPQTRDITVSLHGRVLNNIDTDNRLVFSASLSTPLAREEWHMLSSPLRNVVSGDFCFGGFPLTFMRKFGPIRKDDVDYPVGVWSNTYTKMIEELAPAEGFAFYMYGLPGDFLGSEEYGLYSTRNDYNYILPVSPFARTLSDYGIRKANGILELPFFEDQTQMDAHRTQVYNGSESRFYYINSSPDVYEFNYLTGKSETAPREPNNGNYRFITEEHDGAKWVFNETTDIPGTTADGGVIGGGDDFMVGNPYMSSINMIELIRDNAATLAPEFKLFDGSNYISYSVDLQNNTVTPLSPASGAAIEYVSPMQAFFLKTLSSYDGTGTVAQLNVRNISTTAPSLKLRSEPVEKNILRITAENDYEKSYLLIGGNRDNASNGFEEGEDVKKLFTFKSYIPEIYALADKFPVDIDFIGNSGEVIVPLGIKTGIKGEICLTFTGMDNYVNASKIEFIDAQKNKIVNLTGKSSYAYAFDHTVTGIQNGRFSLRINHSTTALPDIATTSNDIRIYSDSQGIYVTSSPSDPVQQIEVYDFQGRKVYESKSGANYYPIQKKTGNSLLIVKVATKNEVKTVKIAN